MNEGLQFHFVRDARPDLTDLIQSQFPRQHQSFHTLSVPELSRHVVGHIGLGRKVQLRLRHSLLDEGDHAWIRHDKRIDGNVADLLQIAPQRLDIFVMSEDIHSHVAANALAVSIRHALFDFLDGKVSGARPQAEHFASEVDCVCTVVHRDFQFFQISRRSK